MFLNEDDELEPKIDSAPILPSSAPIPEAPQTSNMNPIASDYLKNKYDVGMGDRARAALASLGATLSGGNAAGAGAAVLDQVKQENLMQRQADQMAIENDPNSPQSKLAQQLAVKMGYQGDPSKLTASHFKQVAPTLSKFYDINERGKDRQEKQEERQVLQKEKDQQRAESAADKALNSTTQLLESARGNPAAAQAEKDLYAAQKANSLFNRYKDPNQMNNAEVQLFATEIAKMASGGVPSIHELQGLQPQTLPGSLAKIAEKYSNSPSPANAGEFMRRFKAYSDSLAEDAKKVIKDKYSRVIESRKKQLGSDYYQSLKDKYIDRFDQPEMEGKSQFPKDVMDYASQHGITPEQAQAIKNQRGGG